MSSTTSFQKRIAKVSSDDIVIAYDLLSNLTYLSVLAAAEAPRDLMLRKAGQLRLKTAVFFEQVHLMVQRLGIEYTRALQMVAETARSSSIKNLFLRFAGTISSGESEQAFLRQEARVEERRYSNQYQRSVEALKKWSDAYAAMLVSVSLIVIVSLVSTLMGSVSDSFVVMIGAVMFLITLGGVYIILRTAPYEDVTYDGVTGGPPNRKTARSLFRTLGLMGLVLAAIVAMTFGLGPALLVLGLFLLPAGHYASQDAGKVHAIDQDVSVFVRSLGSVAAARGITLTGALNDLDLKALRTLEPLLLRLRARLNAEIPPDICWTYFTSEAGNELLRRSTEMLIDGVEAGGSPDAVAGMISSYAAAVAELRETRKLTASSFAFLVLPMHVAMVGLLLFVLEIVSGFNSMLQQVAASVTKDAMAASISVQDMGLTMFQSHDMTLVSGMITLVVMVLTVANALVAKFARGGHSLTILSSMSQMSILSGLLMIVVPKVAGSLMAG